MNRTVKYLFFFIGLITFQACEGPIGPEGPMGPEGEPGINILGTTYEVEIDFTESNDYADLFEFPEDLIESDAVLVYRLSGIDNGRDVWRILPQNYFFEEGVLIFNFDYTISDFSIFLDGPLNYSLLGPEWTDGQIFRVVVLPSDFPSGRIDYSDYENTMKMLNIEESDFIRIDSKN
ncbi:hypothetical protein [Algoriphagus halophilus]|uniref:Collagen triple helix repeat-containing protein n=1 Tax=Algoriphagus halophilus TaxID=226505 RepID=A0A1N6GYM7_9BACT|nr:hypothetical protein [Algoriphagus halophilus]SIO12663.1 hypothetical protein SAMN05444394_3395 [Algoriphagus halophilus]